MQSLGIGAVPLAAHPASSDFRDALLSALALLAHADGEMAGAERRRILSLARNNALLADHPDAIVDELAMHEANFRLDPEIAQVLAWEKLARVAGDRRLARMIVDACRTVLRADGVAHPSEYRTLAEIRTLLKVEDQAVGAPADR